MTSPDVMTAKQRAVATLMTRDPVVIDVEASAAEVAEVLDSYGFGGLPVVDWDGEVTGVISETDLIRLRAQGLPWRAWHALRVRDLMTHPAVTVSATAPLAEAARLMLEQQVHRLVVVADDGTPVGILAQSDLVREAADACDDE